MKLVYSFVAIIGTLLLVESCSGKKKIEFPPEVSIFEKRPSKLDSSQILYTFREWGKVGWFIYTDYHKRYFVEDSSIYIYIAKFFENPDHTKMIAWIGTLLPNAKSRIDYSSVQANNIVCPGGADTIYRMDAIIGFRDIDLDLWQIYPLNIKTGICYEDSVETRILFEDYYYRKMAEKEMEKVVQSGMDKGHIKSEPIGYDLLDNEFWDKSLLFQKDTVGSYGLYPFQIQSFGYGSVNKICDKCAIEYDRPPINYPELKRKFK